VGSPAIVRHPYLIVPSVYVLGLRIPCYSRVRQVEAGGDDSEVAPGVGAEDDSDAEDPEPSGAPPVPDPGFAVVAEVGAEDPGDAKVDAALSPSGSTVAGAEPVAGSRVARLTS
jgi:hypothetical protein